MQDYFIDWKLKHIYLKEIIYHIYNGSAEFYYTIEKQKAREFFKFLGRKIPINEKEYFTLLNGQKGVGNILNYSQLGNKTLTNILGSKKKTDETVLEIVKEVYRIVSKDIESISTENSEINLEINNKIVESNLIFQVLLILNSAYATISGSIRSTYGKGVEHYYLQMMVRSFENFVWLKDSEARFNNSGRPILAPNKIYCINGGKWRSVGGTLVKASGRSGPGGREIDLLIVSTFNNSFVPVAAIEFTLGGRGNPSASVNKAKSLETFDNLFPDSLIFFAFDLSDSNIRKDIKKARTIFFREDKESKPIEIVYSVLRNRLKQLKINFHLVDRSTVKNNFQKFINLNCAPRSK